MNSLTVGLVFHHSISVHCYIFRRERGDQLGQVFDKNLNGAWKEIIPQSRLNSLNLYNALNHDWILSQLWTFILRITLK